MFNMLLSLIIKIAKTFLDEAECAFSTNVKVVYYLNEVGKLVLFVKQIGLIRR